MDRIAILWTHWSGYMDACHRALRELSCAETFLCYELPEATAPFALEPPTASGGVLEYREAPDLDALLVGLERFQPTVILITSWHIPAYRSIARAFAHRAVRVLCMDNQWLGTLKQYAGIAAFAASWHRLYDLAFVPGPRQFVFAQRLGFRAENIRLGLYAADVEPVLAQAGRSDTGFLFVGRSVPEKGLDILTAAYEAYRRRAPRPWPLVLVGAHAGQSWPEGIRTTGFVQPADLPSTLAEGRALVLPSRFEPHGLVVHEAAASGLAIIASDAVGATDLFVREGLNGFVTAVGDVPALAAAMSTIHDWSVSQHDQADRISRRLAQQFTPATWAATVVRMGARRRV